jgi:signal peptidase II
MSRLGSRMWRFVLVGVVLSTIGCDRVTKHVATTTLADMPGRSYLADTVWLGYVENPGGFLSLGASLPAFARTVTFTVATGLMLIAVGVLVLRGEWEEWPTIGLTLFLAGGASNWIDRVVRGSVVDFLSVGVGPLRTGVFNVADVVIMAGAGIFLFTAFREHPDKVASAPDGTISRLAARSGGFSAPEEPPDDEP